VIKMPWRAENVWRNVKLHAAAGYHGDQSKHIDIFAGRIAAFALPRVARAGAHTGATAHRDGTAYFWAPAVVPGRRRLTENVAEYSASVLLAIFIAGVNAPGMRRDELYCCYATGIARNVARAAGVAGLCVSLPAGCAYRSLSDFICRAGIIANRGGGNACLYAYHAALPFWQCWHRQVTDAVIATLSRIFDGCSFASRIASFGCASLLRRLRHSYLALYAWPYTACIPWRHCCNSRSPFVRCGFHAMPWLAHFCYRMRRMRAC